VSKSGNRFHLVRQRLNVGKKRGLSVSVLTGDPVKSLLDEFVAYRGWIQACTDVFKFPSEADDISLTAVCVYGPNNELLCMSAALHAGSYAKNFFCLSLERGEARWMAMETLIEVMHTDGVRYLHSDGLLGLDPGNYFFQRKLGYLTQNLREL